MTDKPMTRNEAIDLVCRAMLADCCPEELLESMLDTDAAAIAKRLRELAPWPDETKCEEALRYFAERANR